ncbi:excinuclease ABC subunit UvrA [Gimesia aquarii]|uniref:UvrABC system protein A n=1 Tax=Gimesia aquarii TaxID=2527964 RepID=A0A517VWR9_9PLAN|nr:ATP-binding cassette domain-containing protein [Gimesia aquarii]QDT97447.1 UvrABC system protein A [Gimesia aquarii]
MSKQNENYIRIRGARCHNLKNINVDLPHNQLTVVTGVSGSGKSSLVFDTIHSEGQRRFIENMSPGTRQLLSQMQPADVDQISGLPPTISIDQVQRSQSRRSTLATMTELYDYFRLLYAQLGTVYCSQCEQPLHQQSAEQIVDLILKLEQRQKVMILSPLINAKKGDHTALLNKIAKEGFVRARVDGVVIDVAQPPDLQENDYHDIEIIIDRIIVKEGINARLKESVDLALKHGNGTCIVSQEMESGWSDRFLSTRLACGRCSLSFPDPEPRSFSFNSPYGACQFCQGLGVIEDDSDKEQTCPECQGARINNYSRSVKLSGSSIDQIMSQTAPGVLAWIATWKNNELKSSSTKDQEIANQIMPAIKNRLEYLYEIGLGYIGLGRSTRTLSGGEHQRARLAACLGSGSTGACYILDEPTVGLHASETEKLLQILNRLKQSRNTVVVVEHDLDVVRACDFLLDLGPQAGEQGGEVVASGTYQQVIQNTKSFTARALNTKFQFNRSNMPDKDDIHEEIVLTGARFHNLKDVIFKVPLQKLVCVTGVSGCGKSSLVMDTLVPALQNAIKGSHDHSLEYQSLEGADQLQHVRKIDQSPIGRSGRSSPATFCGVWDEIRKLFAKTKIARIRGYTARRFSFNAKEGRCATCQGQGFRRIDLQFLPDIYLPCRECKTKRFNRQTLSVKYRGKSVSDLLEMSIDEATTFFEQIPKVSKVLRILKETGLGYLALGQPSTMLSGGEAQRLKLATELAIGSTGNTLFVLDEPTRGLHAADIDRLLKLLRRLLQQNHSVLMIEHHPQVMLAADWIVDLGPEGGEAGGHIIDEGTPEEIALRQAGPTGQMLNRAL